MDWLIKSLGSSVGKKWVMAATGLSFCGFVGIHLAGNMTLFGGADVFNGYAEKLHSLGMLLNLAEFLLLLMALCHIGFGAYLFYGNLRARPVRYAKKVSAGGRSLGSSTMPYTGAVLLAFLIFHLLDFHFVDKSSTSIYQIVSTAFETGPRSLFYIVAMAAAGIHASHGLWSAFQSLGLSHEKYTPIIRRLSLLFGIIIGAGFGFIPVYFLVLA